MSGGNHRGTNLTQTHEDGDSSASLQSIEIHGEGKTLHILPSLAPHAQNLEENLTSASKFNPHPGITSKFLFLTRACSSHLHLNGSQALPALGCVCRTPG